MKIHVDVWCNQGEYQELQESIEWVVQISFVYTRWAFCRGPEYFVFVAKPTKKQIRKCIKEFKTNNRY